MEVYEVSPAVNKVANDTPDLVEPYTAPEPRQPSNGRNPAQDKAGEGQRAGLAVLTRAISRSWCWE